MRIPTITVDIAKEAIAKREHNEPWSGSSFVRWIGTGISFNEDSADLLFTKLDTLRTKLCAGPLPGNRGQDFEGPASQEVHQTLTLEIDAATNREFWLWLTFVASGGRFANLVDWRFGANPPIAPVNYGIGRKSEIWEGLFARLWLRGDIGFEPSAEDPYSVARRGGIDIWRSHIIRQEYGRCTALAKALIRFQHPDSNPKSRTLSVSELRELAKRLRIVDASVSYEVLGIDHLREIIERNVEIVRASVGGQEAESPAT